jgi:DNA-binding beta-propeller fold protein YncE
VIPLAVAGLLLAAASALAVTGQLTQLPGTAGCVSETGSRPSGDVCADGKALGNPQGVAVSPDARNVYVVSPYAVAVLARDTTTGALTQLPGTAGCVSRDGQGPCTRGKALGRPRAIAVSPDGKNVYVAGGNASVNATNAVAVFRRSTTNGALTQLPGTAGCVSETGTLPSGETCADGKALRYPWSLAVSPDGKSVYVASAQSDAVAVLRRDGTTGQLTQLAGLDGCIKQAGGFCRDGKALLVPVSVAVSPDGKNAYVASRDSDAVAVLKRNGTSGALSQSTGPDGCVTSTPSVDECVVGKALDGAHSVAISLDGKSLYVASHFSNAVAAFRRNVTSGALTQLTGPNGKAGCVSETGTGGACADGKALDGPVNVIVSNDGQSVYVASWFSDAVVVFSRSTTSFALSQLAGPAGCVSETATGGACVDGKALDGAISVAESADGKSVYVGSAFSQAVAVFAREPNLGADRTPPTFAGLESATTCIPGPIGGGTSSTYHLGWDPASDNVTPSSEIVYDVYHATKPGGEDFSTPTYTTPAGATSFTTPPLPADKTHYFVVRARDQAGNRDSNAVERAGQNLCV